MSTYQAEAVDHMVEGILGALRRDVFAMAAAHQRDDHRAHFLAYLRARHLQVYALQLAALGEGTTARLSRALQVACDAADHWATVSQQLALSPSELAELVGAANGPMGAPLEIVAVDSRFVGFDLNDLPLVSLKLCGSDLTGISAKRAHLDMLDARCATLRNCRFDQARMRHASLREATLHRVSLECANLEASDWGGARVTDSSLRGAVAAGAHLDDARFDNVSLRDVDLSAELDTPTMGATFVRCDLRGTAWHGRDLSGVVFIECKLHGVHGRAKLDYAELERCDIAADGEPPRLATRKDVLKHWAQTAKLPSLRHVATREAKS